MLLAAILASSLVAHGGLAQPSPAQHTAAQPSSSCVNDPSWAAAQKPVRIHGETWHVGPRGLGVFLIASPAGHVLIDGGTATKTRLIATNIESVGIDLRDIKWILNSHAHCDPAGGMQALARESGAQVIASTADAPLLARGGRGDPQYRNRYTFPPVKVTRTVADGEALRLGDLALTAHATPGHTKGNTTWTWTSCEGTRCLDMVLVGSLSAPGFTLTGNPSHPDVIEDFERSFATVAALPCDIALAPHPGMVDFWERIDERHRGNADALIDPTDAALMRMNLARAFGTHWRSNARIVLPQRSGGHERARTFTVPVLAQWRALAGYATPALPMRRDRPRAQPR